METFTIGAEPYPLFRAGLHRSTRNPDIYTSELVRVPKVGLLYAMISNTSPHPENRVMTLYSSGTAADSLISLPSDHPLQIIIEPDTNTRPIAPLLCALANDFTTFVAEANQNHARGSLGNTLLFNFWRDLTRPTITKPLVLPDVRPEQMLSRLSSFRLSLAPMSSLAIPATEA